MSVYETFAKRKRQAENAGEPVIYRYDTLPDPLRVQVAQIMEEAIGDPNDGRHWITKRNPLSSAEFINQCWARIHGTMAREMGVCRLVKDVNPKPYRYMKACLRFVREHDQIDEVFSLIEVAFRLIEDRGVSIALYQSLGIKQSPNTAIAELNHRFLEHSIGYQYQAGQIVRIDSLYPHSEIVEPAISLLHDANFDGALEEFMDAHRHYREQRYKEAIASCGSAFESTMKSICDLREWTYDPKRSSASALIGVLFSNDLIPAELESHFQSLRATLESGLPPVRNKAGRGTHGQGPIPVEVPDYLAAYCLHLTASNIVFLVEAHHAKG